MDQVCEVGLSAFSHKQSPDYIASVISPETYRQESPQNLSGETHGQKSVGFVLSNIVYSGIKANVQTEPPVGIFPAA
jgi:hypothetical protein